MEELDVPIGALPTEPVAKVEQQFQNNAVVASVVALNDNASQEVPTTDPAQVQVELDAGSTAPVKTSYKRTMADEVAGIRQAAMDSALGGDAGKTLFLAEYSKSVQEKAEAEEKLFSQFFTVTKSAYEQAAAGGENASTNVDKVVKGASKAATEMSMAQFFEQKTTETFEPYVSKFGETGGKVVGFGGMLAAEIIPAWSSIEQFGIVPKAIARVTGTDEKRSSEEAVLEMRRYLSSMNDTDRQEVLQNIFDTIKTSTNDVFAWTVIMSIGNDYTSTAEGIDESPAVMAFTEALGAASGVLDATLIGGAVARFAKSAITRGRLIRYLKETKGADAAADATMKAATIGDATLGLTAAEAKDLHRTQTINNILGSTMSGVSSSINQKIWKDAAALIDGARDVLFNSGKTSDEIAAAIKEQVTTLAASNPHVLSVMPLEMSERGVLAQVVHGTAEGKAFRTAAEAQAHADTLGGTTKVVELKSNAGFGVQVDRIVELEKEVETLRNVVNAQAGSRAMVGIDDVDDYLEGAKVRNLEYVSLFSDEFNLPTAKQVLEAVASGSDDELLKNIAQRILNNKSFNLDAVQLGRITDEEFMTRGNALEGAYRYFSDDIGLKGISKGYVPSEATVVHEIVHSVTSQIIDAARKGKIGKTSLTRNLSKEQLQAVSNLDSLYRGLSQSNLKITIAGEKTPLSDVAKFYSETDAKFYGFKDVHEMVSETLTNPAFARLMKSVPISKIVGPEAVEKMGGKFKTAYDAIVQLAARVFGFSLEKEQNAYSAIVENALKIIDTASEEQRTLLKGLVDGKAASRSDFDEMFRASTKPHIKMQQGAMAKAMLAQKEKELIELRAAGDEAFQGFVVAQIKEDPTLLGKVGSFDAKDVSTMHKVLGFDDKHLSSELLVDQYTAALHTTGRYRELLTDYYKNAIGPLKNKERRALFSVLDEGDQTSNMGGLGKEFTEMELFTRWKDEFSPERVAKMQESYYATRVLRNVLHHFKDTAAVRKLKAQGFDMQVQFALDGKTLATAAGKQITDATQLRGKSVWDIVQQKYVPIDDTFILGGHVKVIQLHQAVEHNGKMVRTFMDSGDSTKMAEIRSVIPKRPGEFQRIYDDPFFISATGVKSVDGAAEDFNKTLKTAKNYKEAQAYVKGMNTLVAAQKAGTLTLEQVSAAVGRWANADQLFTELRTGVWDWVGKDGFVVRVSRSEDEYITNFVEGLGGQGKLFQSARNEKLTALDDPMRRNTKSVMESLNAELAAVSRVMSVDELRMSSIQRWFNFATENNAIPKHLRNMSPEEAFFRFRSEDLGAGVDDQNKLFAKRAWQYINEQLGATTYSERKIEQMQDSIAIKLLGDTDSVVKQRIGGVLRHADPITFLRHMTAHLSLGMMNVGQLYVQAASAATAMILHPIHGLPAAKNAVLLRFAAMSDNPAVWRKIGEIANVTSLGMGNVDEFMDTVKALHKSGILSGIQSTSLFTKEDGKFNIFSKTTNRLSEGSFWMFNRGEEMARIISFDVARRVVKEQGGANVLEDAVLRNVIRLQDDYMQNMTKGNQAIYTRGVAGIPFQFMQYQLKLLGNLVGAWSPGGGYRGFSRAETLKLLVGMNVLYGVANGGLPSVATETVGNALEGALDVLDIKDPRARYNARLTVSEGIIAGTLNAASESLLGESARYGVGKRLGPLNWYDEIAEEIVRNEKTLAEAAFGASMKSLKAMGALGTFIKNQVVHDELSPQTVAADLVDLFASASSIGNLQKMWLYKNNEYRLLSSTGTYVAPITVPELFGVAAGMTPALEADYWRLKTNEKRYNEFLKGQAKDMAKLKVRIYAAENAGDGELADKLSRRLNYYNAMPAEDRRIIEKQLEKWQTTWEPSLTKEVSKLLERKWGDASSAKSPFLGTTASSGSVIPERKQ